MAKDMKPEYYRHVIERIYKEVLPYQGKGKVADYIPALAEVDPRQFGIAVEMSSGEVVTQGDANVCFSIQSISKVFTFAMVMSHIGGENFGGSYRASDGHISASKRGDIGFCKGIMWQRRHLL